MNYMHKKFILILTLLIITSCGFHIRDMKEISFKRVSLEGKELGLTKKLKKLLNKNSVDIVRPSENPELRIEFFSEENEKRILSLSGQGLVGEYEIFYRVLYRTKTSDSQSWSENNILETRRDFTFTDASLLGKQEEERRLLESMADEAITNLFNQIQIIK